jgi:hypothetical protein
VASQHQLKLTSPGGVGNSYCPPGEDNKSTKLSLSETLYSKLGNCPCHYSQLKTELCHALTTTGELDTFALDILLEHLIKSCQITEDSPGLYSLLPGIRKFSGPETDYSSLLKASPGQTASPGQPKRLSATIKPGDYFYISPELMHEIKSRHLGLRINACGTPMKKKRICSDCGSSYAIEEMVQNCCSRYCKKCSVTRYERALSRLHSLGIRAPRLIHMIIGFPYSRIAGLQGTVKKHGYIMTAFFRELRKSGINFQGIHTPDIQKTPTPGVVYLHYHYFLLPVAGPKNLRFFHLREIHRVRKSINSRYKTQFTLKFAPGIYRKKNGLLRYAAKRIAGLYGHGNNRIIATNNAGKSCPVTYGFMLPDIMTFPEYCDNFHNIRGCSLHLEKRLKSPRSGLSCNTVPVYDGNCIPCPKCGSYDFRICFEIIHSATCGAETPPPELVTVKTT